MTDAELLTATSWAFNDLCAHTPHIANVTIDGTTINPDTELPYVMGTDKVFKLVLRPHKNIYDMGTAAVFVDDVLVTEGYAWDADEYLVLEAAPTINVALRYYAYYPHPVDDADLLTIPQWAESIVRYRAASHAAIALAFDTANIRQFNTKRDSGTPEHNPLLDQQQWLESMYRLLLEQYAKLERENL
jgi:hypothetical protein